MNSATNKLKFDGFYLQKFRLYETRSKFYLTGRDKSRTIWKVLKIDRLEPTELNIYEDSTIYTEAECFELLTRIHEGNKATGGIRFVTTCYGIIGFIKFLGPYYMILITKRRAIGAIGSHTIYAITENQMIPLLNTCASQSKAEKRYKKLLSTVDLTKDFFFSYSYHVMCSLQKNLCEGFKGQVLYEKMFIWNEFLTRGIRHQIRNTLWTVALVHGFFMQEKFSISGRAFNLTLIARRSRHYAGTRYLKRGVNEKGKVANDVETEQIVFEDAPEGCPLQISSVVQNRGSIPLFWSQEASRVNIRPDIILSEKNQNYEATRLHFENLRERYGNPIIILNLIKTREKKPRESILRAEFVNAIEFINKDLSGERCLKFLHWDLQKHSRRGKNVLEPLGRIAANALELTGLFYCLVTPDLTPEGSFKLASLERDGISCSSVKIQHDDNLENVENTEVEPNLHNGATNDKQSVRSPMFQKGVFRTNCIDCLDRTNVAQYSYGLAALGYQLQALGYIDVPEVELSSPLADDLMRLYEAMGDTLALQYGGSPAHNKIFSEKRGEWKPAIQYQELFRSLQRYYSNAYMDAEKQDAINIFLGHFQPQEGKPALWELHSDQHYNVSKHDGSLGGSSRRSSFKRSLSVGNIIAESNTPVSATNVWKKKPSNFIVGERISEDSKVLSKCTPEISSCETDIPCSRYTLPMNRKQLFMNMQRDQIYFDEDPLNCSNFLDFDWVSSSGNSCEEEQNERSEFIKSLAGMSSGNVVPEELRITQPTSPNGSNVEAQISSEELNNFMLWINYGGTLCH